MSSRRKYGLLLFISILISMMTPLLNHVVLLLTSSQDLDSAFLIVTKSARLWIGVISYIPIIIKLGSLYFYFKADEDPKLRTLTIVWVSLFIVDFIIKLVNVRLFEVNDIIYAVSMVMAFLAIAFTAIYSWRKQEE